MGLAPGTATCLLLVSLDDAFVEAASLCLLIVCRTGHHGPKFCVQGRGKKCNLPFTSWSVAVSSCCSCITFMECRHWHLYVQFCVLFYFILKKTLSKAKEVCDVLRKQLMLDCWFQLLMESHWQWGCLTPLTGVGLFGVLFLFFLILRCCILCQLLIHHFGVGGRCIAVCKLFYYFFIVIIKGLTFSSHHCEITDLFEWNVTLKRLVCCFLCRFSIGVGLGIGTRKWRGCLGPMNVSVVVHCSEACREWKQHL